MTNGKGINNAKDLLEDVRQKTVKESIALYQNFVRVLKEAVVNTNDSGRLTMLFKIGGAAMSPGENGEVFMLITLATADTTYEPLLVAYRDMIRPGAVHCLEHMSQGHALVEEEGS